MKNRTLSLGALTAACAACCTPLILPLLTTATVGAGISGWLFGPLAAGTAALAVLGIWMLRRQQKPATGSHNSDGTCGCAPDSGCNTGDSCDLPEPEKRTLSSRIRALC